MHPPIIRSLFLLSFLFASGLSQAEPPAGRIVMTWVPPYAIEKCRARLAQDAAGIGPKDALTHLAFQFWLPTRDGGVEKTPEYGQISDDAIIQLRDWARAHHIRPMLCIYNYAKSWDWPLAQAGFAGHREDFVKALVAEVQRLDLDGVDVDLEGNGSFDKSKDDFVAFVRDLSAKLHALGKQLTVDSFAYQWNAPNQTWWPELFPLVDALNTMGYTYTGANAAEWHGYAAQKAAAGENAAKLLIGFPSDKADWQGNAVVEHLDWLVRDSSVGVAIWDAQFSGTFWKTRAAWEGLERIKHGH